jgi:ankyrin repeat protein
VTEALRIHEAFKSGDLAGIRLGVGDVAEFPNCEIPQLGSQCLEYAIYHSPIRFVGVLVEMGADPNYGDHAGFPSLIAALSTDRQDKHDLIDLLIAAGADIEQRGINDYTPLHYAAAQNDTMAIESLVSAGADLTARTRIDDLATPLEEAERLGCHDAMRILKRYVTGMRESND